LVMLAGAELGLEMPDIVSLRLHPACAVRSGRGRGRRAGRQHDRSHGAFRR
jgi:hypothetical protein